jgi:hypothetical protein
MSMAKRARKKQRLTTFALPLCLLGFAGFTIWPACSSQPSQANCAELNTGTDTDFDGLADDAERCLGADEFNPDSDGDGVSDGVEFSYPKICVAEDRAAQVRPPVACTADDGCGAGEKCKGLDPTSNDSDGDGVIDGQEDLDLNGTSDFTSGETDPRLWDTDGDGVNDKESGQSICRPDGLAMVTQKGTGGIQVGHDPVFGAAGTVQGPTMNRAGSTLDDAATGVAALVASGPNSGATNTVTDDRTAVEAAVKTALMGAGTVITDVFVGRQFKTHEQYDAVTSTFRLTRASANASGLRDAVVNALTGGTAPGGQSVGASGAFYIDVTTVRRMTFQDVIVAFSPTVNYDNPAMATAIRVGDLVNASAVAEGSKSLDHQCQGVLTGNSGQADIIWTVDISQSMDGNQRRLANTAAAFFSRLRNSGVDFRVGVFNAYSPATTVQTDLAATTYPCWSSGFKFIQGTNMTGDRELCRQVTSLEAGGNGFCPQDTAATDTCGPFGHPEGSNENEEPAAAAVLINEKFKANAAGASTNPDWQWRPDATKVAFFVTDENGTNNDWGRYFDDANIPGTNPPARFAPGGTYNATALNNLVKYFKDNQILTFGAVVVSTRLCNPVAPTLPSTADLPRCVIEGGGGAYIDINATADDDITAAMSRLVDAIAGAASQFKLSRTPITSTIKVSVRNQVVPRSRQDGFDYDPASRTIVFYGNTYRPMAGDQVFISYRVWQGSLG